MVSNSGTLTVRPMSELRQVEVCQCIDDHTTAQQHGISTHRPLSTSFSWFIFRIRPKKELLRDVWVHDSPTTPFGWHLPKIARIYNPACNVQTSHTLLGGFKVCHTL